MKAAYSFIFLSFVVLASLIISGCTQQDGYIVANGAVSYLNRPSPEFTRVAYNTSSYAVIDKIVFKSRGDPIHALLAIPSSCTAQNKCSAFVLLPAQSLTKESEQKWLGNKLNSMGYITLAIDQRGHGETGGVVPDLKIDFETWANKGETVQSKMVHDSLAGFDVLNSLPEADSKKIYMSGQSMGGRFAIIAGSIEQDVAGLLLISTSGYGLPVTPLQNMTDFLAYIDPDSYIEHVSPRKILMLHAQMDAIIPATAAKATYDLAKTPKKFIAIDGDFHGYYNVEEAGLPTALNTHLGWLLE